MDSSNEDDSKISVSVNEMLLTIGILTVQKNKLQAELLEAEERANRFESQLQRMTQPNAGEEPPSV